MDVGSRLAAGLLCAAWTAVTPTGAVARHASAPSSSPPIAAPRTPAGTPQTFAVAVLGDSFADSLADGLRLDLADDPGLSVIGLTDPGLGLAAELVTDGIATAKRALAGRRIGAAVVMLGGDDVHPIRDGDTMVEPPSARWAVLYGDRVAALADQFRAAGVPLTWVGLPIVANEGVARAYGALNAVIRERATKAGAHYVDSWDAFADENGRYDPTGPGKDGQLAKLRAADGRSFTRIGAIKLASFVEADVRRAVRDARAAVAASTDVVLPHEPEFENDINAQIRRELGLPALGPSTRDARGPVIVVTAPPLSPRGQLVAASIAPAALPNAGGMSLAERTLVEGRPLAPKMGRIDDFAWPRP